MKDKIYTGCLMFVIAIFLLSLANFAYAGIALWLWEIIIVPVFGAPLLGYWEMFGLIWLCHLVLNPIQVSSLWSDDK